MELTFYVPADKIFVIKYTFLSTNELFHTHNKCFAFVIHPNH